MKIIGAVFTILMRLWMKIKAIIYTRLLSGCFSSIEKGAVIEPPMRWANLSGVQIGKQVHINRFCWIQTIKFPEDDGNPKLIVGDFTAIGMNATISAAKKIILGEHVLFARNVYISDHGHEFYDPEIPISLQGIREIAEVKIGAHTWLGQNCVVLPGVTIGKHCAIGANSVVSHDIPDYSVAAGVPAKIIKRLNQKTGEWERV